jgi:ATP-dependent Lon protease
MNVPYDLSDVMFICTANSIDTIPEPLLNRMEVIRFTGYSELEKFQIATRHLLPKVMDATGITEKDLHVEDEAIRKIITDFTMEGGVRGLKKRLETLCRKAAVEIAGGRDEILRAVKSYARGLLEKQAGGNETVLPEDLTEDIFESYLDTAGVPDMDLVIRTGGNRRLSNFFPWQTTYAEIWFTDVLWPDFSQKDLQEALDYYEQIQINKGK